MLNRSLLFKIPMISQGINDLLCILCTCFLSTT
nr:MAG TPA: hypothetical protein [Caudoviricetes sp.]